MRNPKFKSLLDEMLAIHEKKNSDYAEEGNPYSNFEFAAAYAQIPVYKVYLVIEGIKTARLHELHKGKIPKNEPIDETYLDKAVYAAIEASHLMKMKDTRNTSLSNFCVYCGCKFGENEVTVGAGDGTGQKFAHEYCFHKHHQSPNPEEIHEYCGYRLVDHVRDSQFGNLICPHK